ncbi:hypothetical protein K402DRAFT_393912 [Aulographum hederae CBS 113979]|uniref:Uncharacterized protein n=1 Tax=Aulographum hederae CBS 113979 TaxID=1176131 RepID=A0A6G1GZT0_9PEZI|nr:hypothetical protein K402DRAFT_393912 [Aulographum hederae CBS 113979]
MQPSCFCTYSIATDFDSPQIEPRMRIASPRVPEFSLVGIACLSAAPYRALRMNPVAQPHRCPGSRLWSEG